MMLKIHMDGKKCQQSKIKGNLIYIAKLSSRRPVHLNMIWVSSCITVPIVWLDLTRPDHQEKYQNSYLQQNFFFVKHFLVKLTLYGRQHKYFFKWKTTSTFSLKWKTTSIFWQMEDDLNILANGRRHQYFGKWKTTTTKTSNSVSF